MTTPTDPPAAPTPQIAELASKQNATALKALNLAREAFDNAGYPVSVPGQSDPGEFYVEIDGCSVAVAIVPL